MTWSACEKPEKPKIYFSINYLICICPGPGVPYSQLSNLENIYLCTVNVIFYNIFNNNCV